MIQLTKEELEEFRRDVNLQKQKLRELLTQGGVGEVMGWYCHLTAKTSSGCWELLRSVQKSIPEIEYNTIDRERACEGLAIIESELPRLERTNLVFVKALAELLWEATLRSA